MTEAVSEDSCESNSKLFKIEPNDAKKIWISLLLTPSERNTLWYEACIHTKQEPKNRLVGKFKVTIKKLKLHETVSHWAKKFLW